MGKTFLAEQFLSDLPAETPRLRSRGLQSGIAPLWPVCDAIGSYAQGRNIDRLRTVVEEYLDALPYLKETLAPLLKASRRTTHMRSVVRQAVPSETFAFLALGQVLEALAESRPAVLFLDDIQWLDAATLSFLGYLTAELKNKRIFLLVTRRVNGKEDAGVTALLETMRRETDRRVLEVSLDRLTRPEQHRVLQSLLGAVDLGPGDLEWLENCSQGRPYYLRELVELLRSDGRLLKAGGTWTLRRSSDDAIVPPTLSRHIRERLSRLLDGDELATDAVRFGACAGTSFDARIVAEALGVPARRIGSLLESVERHTGLLKRDGKTTHFRFDHDLTRDAVLEDLGDFGREIHAKLAEALAKQGEASPEQVAHQFSAAGQHVAASDWYLRGAERAATDLLHDVAQKNAELADRELVSAGVPATSTERLRSAIAIGRALLGGELYEDALHFVEQRLIDAPVEEAIQLHHLAGRAAARLPEKAHHRAAAAHLHSALEGLSDGKSEKLKADVLTDLIYVHDALGDKAASQASFRHAWKVAHDSASPAAMVRLRRLTCIFWQPEKVIEAIADGIQLAKKHRLFYEVALCENNLGSAYFALHELDRAMEHYQRADEGLKTLGGYRRDTPKNNIGVIHLAERRFDQAREFLCTADVISLDAHSRLFIRSNLAVLDALEGQHARALERLERLVREADAAGDPFYRDCLRHNLGVALLEAGRPSDAIAAVNACPPHPTGTDDLLVSAKRARLLVAAHEADHQEVPQILRKEAALLETTTKPQAWLYRTPWYLNDIEFWED